jgi:hypothetical protein
MELFKAHRQWAQRPEDERFDSLEALHAACKGYAADAREKRTQFSDLRVEAVDGDVQLMGRAGVPARLTHWAFGQLCQKLEAPASYLRELPATLACQNLNHGLAQRVKDATGNAIANLLFHSNGSLLLRAVTTDSYSRIWNHEVTERLIDLKGRGWDVARPDIRQMDNRLPLYASDHDMFAFLSNRNVTIDEAGSDGAVYRGVIVENSEVGASALKLTRFLYREMCGNHIIWGASKVMEISVRHVGSARNRWNYYFSQIRRYAEESVSDEQAKIASARSKVIGAKKEDVLDALFGKRAVGLSRKVIEAGYDATVIAQDGPANTQWGIVQGLTRYSQTIPYADKRTEVDRAAGKILEATF